MSDFGISLFSLHTEKLAEVCYERKNCSSTQTVTMLCSRFIANYRQPKLTEALSLVENDICTEADLENNDYDSQSNKNILETTPIDNEPSNELKLFEYRSDKINKVLKDIGFVYNNDKMYTMQPSAIFYYKQKITSYSPNRMNLFQKPDSLINSFDVYKTKEKLYKSIPYKLSPKKSLNHNINENQDYYQNLSPFSRNTGYSKDKYEAKRYFSPNYCRKKWLLKYWSKRHMLFSKFDFGILLDEESFFSVCPEILSLHIAKRCKNDLALDPFCGAGGNIIQLAFTCELVIAVDIDPIKIQIAKHNAEIYGVAHKIEFIVGDFFELYPKLKADVVFMSPPWGGPNYSENFSLENMCKDHFAGGFGIFTIVKDIAPSIAFHMPKTTNIFECLWMARRYGRVEIQQNIIDEKLDSITAFYGEFTDITDNDY